MNMACPSKPFGSSAGRARRTLLGGAVLGLSLLAAPSAHAQQKASKDELDKARVAFTEGVALAAANNCAGALVKYKAVIKVISTPQILFNIGECEERLGRLVEAIGSYRIAASQAADDKKAANVLKAVGSRIDDIEGRLPKLTISRGKGAEAAAVELDGQEVGQLGAAMPVNPGPHVIVARVSGKEYLRETVTLAEKETKTFDVKITIAAPPPPKVEEPPPPPPAPPPPRSRVPGIAVTAVGGVALITGFIGIAVSQGAISTLNGLCKDGHCPNTQSAMDTASKGKTMTGLAEIMIPLGAVGAGVGIYLIASSGPQKAKAPASDASPPAGASRGPSLQLVGWAPGASVGGASLLGSF
jgi:hypothetical protein